MSLTKMTATDLHVVLGLNSLN